MKLNPNCIRDILLTTEANTGFLRKNLVFLEIILLS